MKNIFLNSQEIRNSIIDSLPIKLSPNYKISVCYIFPTKYCPIGCEHCMYASPSPANIDKKMILSNKAINRFIEISKESNMELLSISGGGEPLLERNKVYELIDRATFTKVEINSGGYWIKSEKSIKKTLCEIQEHIEKRKKLKKFEFNLRLSIDKFHQKVIKIENIVKLIKILRKDSEKNLDDQIYKDINIYFRSILIHDNTIKTIAEKLNANLVNTKMYVDEIRFKKKIKNGLNSIMVYYKNMNYIGRATGNPDLAKPTVSFDECIKSYQTPENGISTGKNHYNHNWNKQKMNGLNILANYDGKIFPYGGTPDISLDLYSNESYKKFIDTLFKDPVSSIVIEYGIENIVDIAHEVESDIKKKIKEKSWLASISDLCFATAHLRLYISIRLIQILLQSGYYQKSDIPPAISKYIELPRSELIKQYYNYVDSQDTIEYQFINENASFLYTKKKSE